MPAPRFTEEFCNREYNNRARVPGNEQLHAAHVAQSHELSKEVDLKFFHFGRRLSHLA